MTPEEQAVFDALTKDVAENRKALEYRTKQLDDHESAFVRLESKKILLEAEVKRLSAGESQKNIKALLDENDHLRILLKDAVQRNEHYGVPFGGLAKYHDIRTKEIRLMKSEVISLNSRLESYLKEIEAFKDELDEVRDARIHAAFPDG